MGINIERKERNRGGGRMGERRGKRKGKDAERKGSKQDRYIRQI